MNRSARFWIGITVFQILFGLAIFAITRQYYLHGPETGPSRPVTTGQRPLEGRDRLSQDSPAESGRSTSGQPILENPSQVSRQADEAFDNREFERAAELYAELLEIDPKNVNAYNNLGLTLHYIGRSDEALRKLNEGVALDPTYQRIWLTLGFVSSQLGNIRQARSALTTAAEMDAENEVGESALKMLNDLPVETLSPVGAH